MKQDTKNQAMAQAVNAWNEKEKHEQIMKALSGVYGTVSSYVFINGNYYYWSTHSLPETEALAIMERGNHEEIMYMIHQYGKANCADTSGYHLNHVMKCILPESVQRIIAERNDREEMDAYLMYNGFGEAGQDIVLDRGNHDEIMRYLARHGFSPAQQRRLRVRGNHDEMELHVKRHGWCDEILSEMFENLAKTGNCQEFLDFVSKHELPVAYQFEMLKTVPEHEFLFYVERYGLWEQVLADMVKQRSAKEILFYIKKHRYLSSDAERELANRHLFDVNMAYVEYRYYKKNFTFAERLLATNPIDHKALAALFLQMQPGDFPFMPNEEKIIKNGSHEEVMKYVTKYPLSVRALATLFFRNNAEELEAYINNKLRKL